MMADRAYQERDSLRVKAVELLGGRTVLCVPMLKDGTPIGVIAIWRREVQAFSKSQIQLLSTFADQAVIAIENVRLFQELGARNRDLTEALEQQTATAENLGVISSSPTDVQPVLDAVAGSAARLCEAEDATIYLIRGEVQELLAHHGPVGHTEDAMVLPISRDLTTGRAMLDRRTIHVPDLAAAADEFPGPLRSQDAMGITPSWRPLCCGRGPPSGPS